MQTVRVGVDDIVRGLDLGADDYVVEPFNVNELAARVKTVLHRARPRQNVPQEMLVSGALVIDFAQRLVKIADKETPLPPVEYRLLCLLARNAGKVITCGHLLTEVWGPEYYGDDIHILEVAIARLRKRLADGCGDYNYISTRRGVGYFFSAPSAGFPSSAASLAAAQQWNHVRRRRPALVPPSQLSPVMQRHQRSPDEVFRHTTSWE